MGVRWQRLPQAGQEIGGSGPAVLRQAGKVANCQGGMFLAYVSPLGRALVDKRLYLPKSWTSDQDRCAAGCAGGPAELPVKDGVALEMLERVLELGYLRAEWVAGDDAFGMSPTFREGLAALGMRYVLEVPAPGPKFRAALRSGPWTRLGPVRNIRGSAAPANPSCGLGSGGPWSSAVMNCRMRLGGR